MPSRCRRVNDSVPIDYSASLLCSVFFQYPTPSIVSTGIKEDTDPKKVMDKNSAPSPPIGINEQPPPYSPPTSVHPPPIGPFGQPHQIHIYNPQSPPFNYTHQDTIIQAHAVTHQPGRTIHVITSSSLFGPNPRTLTCTKCNITGTTRTVHEPSMSAHVLACTLCIFGCWPCAPCVYCVEPCLNVNHYCPNCNTWQGSYVPM